MPIRLASWALAVLLVGFVWRAAPAAIEAVPGKAYRLTERHGPWMIMVTSLSGTEHMSDARDAADQLVLALRKKGVPAYLIDDASEIRREWLEGKHSIGLTAGASAPEVLVEAVVRKLKEWGAEQVSEAPGIRERGGHVGRTWDLAHMPLSHNLATELLSEWGALGTAFFLVGLGFLLRGARGRDLLEVVWVLAIVAASVQTVPRFDLWICLSLVWAGPAPRADGAAGSMGP